MTLNELIERLEEYRDAGDVEVRIASQPSYPLAADVGAVTIVRNGQEMGRKGAVLWIAASGSVGYGEDPYAPKHAWNDTEVNLDDLGDEVE